MNLQKIKMIVSAGWMLTVLAVAITTSMSWPVQLALAAVGLLPPLALLLWWNEPTQTMSETINQARR
jgi:cytochrome c oxidase subunit IV